MLRYKLPDRIFKTLHVPQSVNRLSFGSIYVKYSSYSKPSLFALLRSCPLQSSICCVNFPERTALYANLGIIRLENYLRVKTLPPCLESSDF